MALNEVVFPLDAGEALPSTPLLEILDLSWNSSISGSALQDLLGKLPPSLRELHLVACQLTAVDAAALGNNILCWISGRHQHRLFGWLIWGCFPVRRIRGSAA